MTDKPNNGVLSEARWKFTPLNCPHCAYDRKFPETKNERLRDFTLGDAATYIWAMTWRTLVWVVIYSLAAKCFGLEDTWQLFFLCCICGIADRLLYRGLP